MKKQNNINKLNTAKKKLLAYVTLATLGSSVLTGCSNSTEDSVITYTTTDEGDAILNDTISYSHLSELVPLKVKKLDDTEKVFITDREFYSLYSFVVYTDILTNKCIIDSQYTSLEYEEIGDINDYLVSMEIFKEEYNREDIEQIVEYISECEKENPKVKEKTAE